MSAAAQPPLPIRPTPDRAAVNRANSQHSTGPRTQAGKHRSSLNALRHGLTARTAVLPTEDPSAFQHHLQQFFDEYRPATPTETQLVHELANTAWRLNRIPLLEAELLSRAGNPRDAQPGQETVSHILDAHRALATLGLHGQRLSRQFQRVLDQLREIQDTRRELERKQLRDAADLLAYHQHKGLPWQPANHGFVFSKEQVERHAHHLTRLNEARHIGYVRFNSPTQLTGGAVRRAREQADSKLGV
jgi:hypothetical protein